MRSFRLWLVVFVLMVASFASAERKSSFSLELGYEFSHGLVNSSAGRSNGVGLNAGFGGDISERLWLGVFLGSSWGKSDEWSSVPRVFSLGVGLKWWFAGRDARVYIPALLGGANLKQESGYSSETWIAPMVSLGLGVSISRRIGLEARYTRAFEADNRTYRELDRSFASSGVYLVVRL